MTCSRFQILVKNGSLAGFIITDANIGWFVNNHINKGYNYALLYGNNEALQIDDNGLMNYYNSMNCVSEVCNSFRINTNCLIINAEKINLN